MLGDTFDFEGKTYEIKKDLTFGEYKKISKISNSLQQLQSEFEHASDEEKAKIINQFSKTTEDQLQMMSDFLEDMVGLKQKDIDALNLIAAIELFNKSFTMATNVKKKSKKI